MFNGYIFKTGESNMIIMTVIYLCKRYNVLGLFKKQTATA